ncbi:MAG: hypothetical protein IKF42_04215 [Mogibacterium sp.]|nr:hypothetical protein [Mogibacterium sp.]
MEEKKIEIVTSSGFKCKLEPARMDDMRIFDNIVVIESDTSDFEKLKASVQLFETLLGKKQKDALYKHLEKTEGQARTASFRRELNDILAGLSKSKKK